MRCFGAIKVLIGIAMLRSPPILSPIVDFIFPFFRLLGFVEE